MSQSQAALDICDPVYVHLDLPPQELMAGVTAALNAWPPLRQGEEHPYFVPALPVSHFPQILKSARDMHSTHHSLEKYRW